MAQREGDGPSPGGKGGTPNALHRLKMGFTPREGRRKRIWLRRRRACKRMLQGWNLGPYPISRPV